MTQSPLTREVEMARRAADSERTTILIQGESGIGKDISRRHFWNAIDPVSVPGLSL